MTAAGEEEEVGGAAAFGGESAATTVGRRVSLSHTTLASECPGMGDAAVSS